MTDTLNKEIIKYLKESEISEYLPKQGMYDLEKQDGYGVFESKFFKDESPKKYFDSSRWIDFLRENIFSSLNKENRRDIFKDSIDMHLDKTLQFFGQAKVADKLIDEKLDLNEIFNKVKIKVFKKNNELIEFEDFKEEFKLELIDFIAKHDKSKVSDLYLKKEIPLLLSPIEKPDFVESSMIIYSKEYDAILLTEEVIEIFNKLNITQEVVEDYYKTKGIDFKKISSALEINELESYELLNKKSDEKPLINFEDIIKVAKALDRGLIPAILTSIKTQEFINKFSKEKEPINVKDGVLCLIEENGLIREIGKVKSNLDLKLNDVREADPYLVLNNNQLNSIVEKNKILKKKSYKI